jgi:Ca-activated chloride channel family protein
MGRFGNRKIAPLVAVLAAGVLGAQQPTFQVDVRLVRILATVKTQAGELIGNLSREDFQVSDNGVPQQLSLFEHHTEQPLSIAVMIDTSASTNIDLKYEVESVNRFYHALFKEGNPDDAASLFAFNYETTLLCDFTHRLERLERNLKGLRGEGGTSMYDAIHLVSGNLEGREGRHVMIIVTDGGDTTSSKTYHQALQAAQRADAVLYPILVVPIPNDPGRNTGGEHALATLAAGTGGRVFAPALGPQLDYALSEILRDLRTQYLLGYYPKNIPPTKEPFHKLEVKVLRGADLRVSARSGYYGEIQDLKGWRAVR